jgi:transcriptional regulator of acetoin/glycerol metabolism
LLFYINTGATLQRWGLQGRQQRDTLALRSVMTSWRRTKRMMTNQQTSSVCKVSICCTRHLLVLLLLLLLLLLLFA